MYKVARKQNFKSIMFRSVCTSMIEVGFRAVVVIRLGRFLILQYNLTIHRHLVVCDYDSNQHRRWDRFSTRLVNSTA